MVLRSIDYGLIDLMRFEKPVLFFDRMIMLKACGWKSAFQKTFVFNPANTFEE